VNRYLLCVFLLISAAACRGADRRTFSGLEQASRALQPALAGNTTVATYRDLLNSYATELSAVRGHVTNSRERAILAEYDAAMKPLTDMRLVWESKEAGSEMLRVADEVPARIAREYELGINTNDPPSIYATEALHAIATSARQHLEKASRLLAG